MVSVVVSGVTLIKVNSDVTTSYVSNNVILLLQLLCYVVAIIIFQEHNVFSTILFLIVIPFTTLLQ